MSQATVEALLVWHAEWEARVGPVPKARFFKAFRPLCEPTLRYEVPLVRLAIEWHAAIRRGTRQWDFVKPEPFVSGITEHVRIARMDPQDRVRLLPLAPAGAA